MNYVICGIKVNMRGSPSDSDVRFRRWSGISCDGFDDVYWFENDDDDEYI